MGLCLRLNSCCCGCSLKTGSLIIGIFETIASCTGICVCLPFALGISFVVNEGDLILEDGQVVSSRDVFPPIIYTLIAMGCLFAIALLSNVILLCGVCKDKAGLLMTWTIFTVILMFANVSTFSVLGVLHIKLQHTGIGVATITISIVYFLIRWYYVCVVHSYYRELKRSHMEEA